MSKYTVPFPAFAADYLAAKNLDRSAFDIAVKLATTQFKINEAAKEYATGVAKSEMYIGLDVERVLAVELGAVKVQIAKDRAMYKSQIAESVKTVKMQQAHLEGQFGIDVAATKKEFDLAALENISYREEETATLISNNEYVSSAGLALEAEDSANKVNLLEDVFRRTLSDSDYDASVANADVRATKIKERGLLEKSSTALEGAVTRHGITASGVVEAEGIATTAVTQGYAITMQGDSDISHIMAMHELKKDLTASQLLNDLNLIASQTDTKVTSTQLETLAQISSDNAMSAMNIDQITNVGLLETKYIGIDAAAQDQAYLMGAREDLKVDTARYTTEASGIRELAKTSVAQITAMAAAEGESKILAATIEGEGAMKRAIAESNNDVLIATQKAGLAGRIAGIHAQATADVASKQSAITAEMSAVVLKQIGDDAESERAHMVRMSAKELERFTTVQEAEIAASVKDAAEYLRHAHAVGLLNSSYLMESGAAQTQFIVDRGSIAVGAITDKFNEETRYMTADNEQRVLKLQAMSGRTVAYILQDAKNKEAYIKDNADASSENSRHIVDAEYQSAITLSNAVLGISSIVSDYEWELARVQDTFSNSMNQSIAKLRSYGVAYTNSYKATGAGGTIVTANTDYLSLTFPSAPQLP